MSTEQEEVTEEHPASLAHQFGSRSPLLLTTQSHVTQTEEAGGGGGEDFAENRAPLEICDEIDASHPIRSCTLARALFSSGERTVLVTQLDVSDM